MAFALPLLVQLFDAIDGTVQWLGGASAPTQPTVPSRAPQGLGTPASTPARPSTQQRVPQRHWSGPTRSFSAQRPLRVVRAVEQRRHQAAAGRMVISGRMADVCAELDRLAAQETLH